MYPILIVFLSGIVIAIERWLQLTRVRNVNRNIWNRLHPMLVKGEFDKARSVVGQDTSAIPLLLLHAKLTATTGHIIDSLEMASVKALNCFFSHGRRSLENQ